MRPGPAPIAGLAARLASAGIEPAICAGALAADPDALGAPCAPRRAGTILLVVDQLEELFTLCDDPEERALYAAALARAARSADDPVRVVMTLRDDFLVRAEALPGLALAPRPGPADPHHAGRAGPAPHPGRAARAAPATSSTTRRCRTRWSPRSPARPGALALLSFTASQLWELRDRRFRQLGRKAYRSLGGVGGALAQHAEATLAAMPAEEQRLVREVFRHPVTAEGTRAVLSPAELEAALGGGPHAAPVIEKLVAARLLVVSDAELGERIEVAHEALLEAWPRLVAWRREDAEGARLRDLAARRRAPVGRARAAERPAVARRRARRVPPVARPPPGHR